MYDKLYITPVFKRGRGAQLRVDLVYITDLCRITTTIGIGHHGIGRLAGIGGNESRQGRLIGWRCNLQMYILS